MLSTLSLAWCVSIGGWLWFTPIRYEQFINDVATLQYQSFSEVSLFGPAPLIVPVLIAAIAARAAWRGRGVVLGLAAFLLAVFTFTSGLSIGAGYLRATALLMVAVLVPFLDEGERRRETAQHTPVRSQTKAT